MPKLNAYRGLLSAPQVAEGINHAASNALRLAADAELLLSSARFSTACSIAALSIEESGKVSILRELALATSNEEARTCWKRYRTHTHKNVSWLLPQLALSGATRLTDFISLFKNDAEHPEVLDHLKQLGFYTDCLGKAHWSVPIDVVDEKLSRRIVNTAKLLAPKGTCTVREIELWIQHLGPVSRSDLNSSQQGLVTWYAAMQAEGLKPEGVNQMERFVKSGVGPSAARDA